MVLPIVLVLDSISAISTSVLKCCYDVLYLVNFDKVPPFNEVLHDIEYNGAGDSHMRLRKSQPIATRVRINIHHAKAYVHSVNLRACCSRIYSLP